jgi:hypothetical protein
MLYNLCIYQAILSAGGQCSAGRPFGAVARARLKGLLARAARPQTVAWLDVLSARVRYGQWIGGVLPEIVPWDNVFHARGAAAVRRRARDGEAPGGAEQVRRGRPQLLASPLACGTAALAT